jgi:hypothetical protein
MTETLKTANAKRRRMPRLLQDQRSWDLFAAIHERESSQHRQRSLA